VDIKSESQIAADTGRPEAQPAAAAAAGAPAPPSIPMPERPAAPEGQ
jgi:hypothetical protein